jgi:hypothetical protein
MSEREQALEACKKLRLAIDDTEGLLKAVEGARMQISSTADELRGQTSILKERVAWLIRELDTLRKHLGRSTRPGDAR